MNDKFKGYYKKTRKERINILKENGYISNDSYNYLINEEILKNDIADKLIENQIGVFGVPFGIAPNFLINNEEFVIPMSTEEPSVIAAASNGSKIIKENGGIDVILKNREMIGQISFYDVKDFEKSIKDIKENEKELLKIANDSHKGIVNIGGGAKKIEVLKKDKFLIVYLYVDTKDAMGANIINTMLESMAIIIENIIKAKKLMSIISNYSTNTIVKATCKLKVEKEFGEKMQLAYEFAKADIYRAVTNNKGVLNGISAVTLITGNDTRAIEACIHSYASRDGKYTSLTKWEYKEGYLYGSLEIPIPIATKGGSIGVNNHSNIALEILKNPDAIKLSKIISAVGLVQNFAALRALVTVGIQSGHMKLHARTIAIFAGAKENEIDKLVEKMIERNLIDIVYAKEILGEIRK